MDYIIVPIGGGGLHHGHLHTGEDAELSIKVIGVEPVAAASRMTAAMEKGEPVTLPSANTIADGTAVKRVGETIFPYCQ